MRHAVPLLAACQWQTLFMMVVFSNVRARCCTGECCADWYRHNCPIVPATPVKISLSSVSIATTRWSAYSSIRRKVPRRGQTNTNLIYNTPVLAHNIQDTTPESTGQQRDNRWLQEENHFQNVGRNRSNMDGVIDGLSSTFGRSPIKLHVLLMWLRGSKQRALSCRYR